MILTTMADYERNLNRTREAFENFARSPLGCHGRRRMNYVRSCLCRLILVEKAMIRDSMPVKRFATLGIQIDFTRAMTACWMTDDEVTTKKRSQRSVGFRWAWFTVGRECGYSYTELARSMGRNSHSWLLDIPAKMQTGMGKNACLARKFTKLIRKALDDKRCGSSHNFGTGRPSSGGNGQRAGRSDDPRPVPDAGQRGSPVYGRGAEETGDLVPCGVAMVRG